jgi:glycine oxidase
MADVLIIGAGAIGCATAWRLAARGAAVEVIEKSSVGVLAASQAAAGMLSAQLEHHPSEAMAALCMASRERYPAFVTELEQASGIEVDYRRIGAVRVAVSEADADQLVRLVKEQHARGWAAELVDVQGMKSLAPGLGEVALGAYFGGECAIDPPALLRALALAAERRGVRIRTTRAVVRIHAHDDHVVVELADGERVRAGKLVLAAGAWSAGIEGSGVEGLVRPVRGQMLELNCERPPALLIEGPDAYLSPRTDGRVLVGSTLEEVGFARAVTAAAAARLLAGALRLFPALAEARLSGHWCGFRAASPDALPLIGASHDSVIVATGHYRNGIVLTPVTAEIAAAQIAREPLASDLPALTAFAPTRSFVRR